MKFDTKICALMFFSSDMSLVCDPNKGLAIFLFMFKKCLKTPYM